MFIEDKSAALSGGPARIGRVTFSKTGRTVYYQGRSFQRWEGFKSNHVDVKTGEEFWISGPRRDGLDRLYGERVPVEIDADCRAEYWTEIRRQPERAAEARTNPEALRGPGGRMFTPR